MGEERRLRQEAMLFNLAVRFTTVEDILKKYKSGESLLERDMAELAWVGNLWQQMDRDSRYHETTNDLQGYATYFQPHFHGACLSEGILSSQKRDNAYLFLSGKKPEIDRRMIDSLIGIMKRLRKDSEQVRQGNL